MAAARPLNVRLDDDGVLHLEGVASTDPLCPECGERIRLPLDLVSFVVGRDHLLVHARCVWRPQVFQTEGWRAHESLAAEERRSRSRTG